MSYYDQPSSYPGGPSVSSYPGGPTSDQGQVPPPYERNSYSGNNNGQDRSAASSYYDNYPSQPYQSMGTGMNGGNNMNSPIRYDERGNPIPQPNQTNPDGDRGLGTMALGAMGGVAANKMSGGNHSNLAYAAGGAALAEGARIAFELFEGRNRGGFGGGGFGGRRGGFGGGGFGGHRGGRGGRRREERRLIHDVERLIERR